MKSVSMLDFRRNAEAVIARVQRGQSIVLTYRGKPVARLEPVARDISPDDPFYRIHELADARGKSLTNKQIDETLYGQ